MLVRGITFVGTRTAAVPEMTRFCRDVLGLEPQDVPGGGAAFFRLPDGSSFAVAATEDGEPAERTVGFLVDDVERAAAQLRAAGLATDEVTATDVHRYIHFRAPDGRLYELVEVVR